MKIVCVICQDLLLLSESESEIFSTRCGHVFHFSCVSQWLERSKSCPQCREKVTENSIYRVYFTLSNSETSSGNSDNSSLQERVDSLQFQLLLKEKNIKYYTSKNVILEKQNAGLRQEVRKVESEINQKNSAIHVLKEQITYFKEKYGKYKFLTQKLCQKEKELEQFRNMRDAFSKGSREDIRRMIEKTKDHDTLITCISVMKKELEELVELWKNENVSLKHRINELENINNLLRQNVTQSDNQRNLDKNSSSVTQKVDVYSQRNTKRKIENQNTSLSPRIKTNEHRKAEMVIKMNQKDISITSECPTIVKRAKLRLRSEISTP